MNSLKSVDEVERLPDILLPSQFFDKQTFSSEQRLMLAILADVINVLREYRVSSNEDTCQAFDEASSWVFDNGIASSLSFDHVCEAVGMDAESMRRRLSELVSEPGRKMRKLRLKPASRRHILNGSTINRIRRG